MSPPDNAKFSLIFLIANINLTYQYCLRDNAYLNSVVPEPVYATC